MERSSFNAFHIEDLSKFFCGGDKNKITLKNLKCIEDNSIKKNYNKSKGLLQIEYL